VPPESLVIGMPAGRRGSTLLVSNWSSTIAHFYARA
jgi:hypothetical protein